MDVSSVTGIFSSVPLDALVILAAIAVIAAYTARAGMAPAISLAIALPAALALQSLMQNTIFLSGVVANAVSPLLQAGVFLALVLVLTILIDRAVTSYDDTTGLRRAVMGGVSSAIVLTVVWLRVPALASIWDFGPQIETLFGSAYALFWIIGAYVLLGIARR